MAISAVWMFPPVLAFAMVVLFVCTHDSVVVECCILFSVTCVNARMQSKDLSVFAAPASDS